MKMDTSILITDIDYLVTANETQSVYKGAWLLAKTA